MLLLILITNTDLISCHDQEGNICLTDPNSFVINFDLDYVAQRRLCLVDQTSFVTCFALE